MAGAINVFVLNEKRLSLHMDQTSQHINYTNNYINYDHMIKMIVNLVSKKGDRNDDDSPKVTDLNTPKKDISQSEVNTPTRKVHKFLQIIPLHYFILNMCYV